MKILIISNLYKPFARGGAEVVAEIMADRLSSDHDVTVLSARPYFDKRIFSAGYKTIYWSGIYSDLGKMPFFLRIFWHFADALNVVTYFRLRSLLDDQEYDLVITHNLKGIGYMLPMAIRQKRVRHIHVLHDVQLFYPSGLMYHGRENDVDRLPFRIYSDICANLFASPTKIISPSRWLADMHLERGFFPASEISILRNPIVSVDAGMEKRREGRFRFLFAGQLEKHKGVLGLIEAFKSMPENGKCELLIAGSGSQEKELREIASDCPNISFLGWVKIAELRSLMSGSDCLVMTSLCYENSPTVISEAAARGLPAISSDIGGAGELIDIFSGYLYAPGNVRELSEKMSYVVNNRTELAEKSLKARSAAGRMTIDDYVARLLDFS